MDLYRGSATFNFPFLIEKSITEGKRENNRRERRGIIGGGGMTREEDKISDWKRKALIAFLEFSELASKKKYEAEGFIPFKRT